MTNYVSSPHMVDDISMSVSRSCNLTSIRSIVRFSLYTRMVSYAWTERLAADLVGHTHTQTHINLFDQLLKSRGWIHGELFLIPVYFYTLIRNKRPSVRTHIQFGFNIPNFLSSYYPSGQMSQNNTFVTIRL